MILFLIVVGLILGISWVIWTVYHVQLSNALRWIRVAEMKIVSLHTTDLPFADSDGNPVLDPQTQQPYTFDTWYNWAKTAKPVDITPHHLGILTRGTMAILKTPIAIMLGVLAFWAMLFGPGTQFRRRMGLEDLIAAQAKVFPLLTPFVKFNPAKLQHRAPGQPVPARLPLFAEALSPEEWVAYNRLPVRDDKTVDEAAAAAAFAKQLGRRWQGPSRLPLHGQALFAAFALKHARKRDASDELLNDLSRCWTPDNGLRIPAKLKREIRGIINDPKLGGDLAKHCQKHAFQVTALLKALSRARTEGGVLAPAQFLWLRGYHRALWYPMNNLGRKSFHPEAAGALSHYIAELNAGQRIPSPKVQEAVTSLNEFLKSLSAREIPPLDMESTGGKYWKKK